MTLPPRAAPPPSPPPPLLPGPRPPPARAPPGGEKRVFPGEGEPRVGAGHARAEHLLVQQAPVRRRQEDVPQETIVLVGLLGILLHLDGLSAPEGGEMGGGFVGEELLP